MTYVMIYRNIKEVLSELFDLETYKSWIAEDTHPPSFDTDIDFHRKIALYIDAHGDK